MASKGNDRARTSSLIKVLHVINDLSVGGAEMMLYKLLSEMDAGRFESAVISLKSNGALRERIEELDVAAYTTEIGGAVPTPAALWRLVRLIRRVRPDVIQGWMPHGNLAAVLAGVFAPARVPVLWNIRRSLNSLDDVKPITVKAIKLGARLSHKPAGIIYNSRRGAAQYAAFGYSNEKSVVIYNGFNTELFVPSEEARLSVRRELGLAHDSILIGLVSRYHPTKNHPNFLRAAALLLRQHPDANFILSGGGINQDNKPLQSLIRELGLSERTHLLGVRRDIERVIAALDIAALASNAEGFPNVIGEAMACAVPCVATKVSDLPWIIKGAGLIVPKNNHAALAGAFARILELGVEGRRTLGLAGRDRVMKHFRLSAVAAQYGAYYESVINLSEHERINVGYGPALENYSNRSSR